ncbi:hypothetical protein DSO57_1033450, partial [Entomophthora muscae]
MSHLARIFLEVSMILFEKKAHHISVTFFKTASIFTSFEALFLYLSHLDTSFNYKLVDCLPAHSQFDFQFKPTVNLVKVASSIYLLKSKEKQCLEEWTKDMEAKGKIFR